MDDPNVRYSLEVKHIAFWEDGTEINLDCPVIVTFETDGKFYPREIVVSHLIKKLMEKEGINRL